MKYDEKKKSIDLQLPEMCRTVVHQARDKGASSWLTAIYHLNSKALNSIKKHLEIHYKLYRGSAPADILSQLKIHCLVKKEDSLHYAMTLSR